jgi:hypothetical protein
MYSTRTFLSENGKIPKALAVAPIFSLKILQSDCWSKTYFFMCEATILHWLQTPLPSIVAFVCVLVKQEV